MGEIGRTRTGSMPLVQISPRPEHNLSEAIAVNTLPARKGGHFICL